MTTDFPVDTPTPIPEPQPPQEPVAPTPPTPATRAELIQEEASTFERSIYSTCMAIAKIAAIEDRRVNRGILGQNPDGSFEMGKPHPIFAGDAVTVTVSIEEFLTQKLRSFNGWEMISVGKGITFKGDTYEFDPSVLYVKAHKSNQCTLINGAYCAPDSLLVGKVRFANGDTRPAIIGRHYPVTFGGNPMVEDLTQSLMFANNFGIFRVVNFNKPGMRVLDTLGFRNLDTFWTNQTDTESEIYHRIRNPEDKTKFLWRKCDDTMINLIRADIEEKIVPHQLAQIDARNQKMYEAQLARLKPAPAPEVAIEVKPEAAQPVEEDKGCPFEEASTVNPTPIMEGSTDV